jgi:hypothetical protein
VDGPTTTLFCRVWTNDDKQALLLAPDMTLIVGLVAQPTRSMVIVVTSIMNGLLLGVR